MAQLTQDTQLVKESLSTLSYPIDSSAVIYDGAAVGLNASTKKARQLVAGDLFLGHAKSRADNSGGSVLALGNAARSTVDVDTDDYGVVVTVTGASDDGDIGKPVYASDSQTYTLTSTSNSYIGKIVRYDSVRGKHVVAIDRNCIGGVVSSLSTSVGTPNDTIPDVGAAFNQTTLNNIIATLAGKINSLASVVK